MRSNDQFNLLRFVKYLRFDFTSNLFKMLLFAEALWGILLILLVYLSGFKEYEVHPDKIMAVYNIIILVLGAAYISFAFSELSDSAQDFYLTLPVSALEKLLGRFLLFYLGFIVVANLVFYTAAITAYGIYSNIFNSKMLIYSLFNPTIIKGHLTYFILTPVFFYGAVAFRKYNFFKTVLSLSSYVLLLALISYIILIIIFWDFTEGFGFEQMNNTRYQGGGYYDLFSVFNIKLMSGWIFQKYSVILHDARFAEMWFVIKIILFSPFLPILFFALSFIKLRESEG